MTNEIKKRDKYFQIIKNGLFYNHPVLVGGLALAPALIASTSLKNALAISLCLFIVSLPSMLFASIIKQHLSKWLRVMVYCLIASIFYIPAYILIINFYPEAYFNLGVFLPLIVVSSFIYTKSEKYSKKIGVIPTLLDSVFSSLGFTIFTCSLGAIREIIGQDKIWGFHLNLGFNFEMMNLPFIGFIIAGFCAALVRFIYLKKQDKQIPLELIYGEEDQSDE